ncbi:MAG: acylphosphatase [Acidobacteria bacterium]|nr:MAG: acylphosphatase [Acidobacteriota bacterium]
MVQGVGYRFFAQDAAERLGLSGYVRNLRDGRVEVYAIGGAEQLAEFWAALQRGPSMSRVARVAEERAQLDERYAGEFVIEHTF